MADSIPAPDAEFDGRQENRVTYAAANAVALGLDRGGGHPGHSGRADGVSRSYGRTGVGVTSDSRE